MDASYKRHSIGEFIAIFLQFNENTEVVFPLDRTVFSDYQPFWELSNLLISRIIEIKDCTTI